MRTPGEVDAQTQILDRLRQSMHTGMPARVTAYDPVTQTIHAQPEVRQARLDEDEERVIAALPTITDIPVLFPGGAGFRVTWPIAVGDPVWLQFSEVSLDRWVTQGQLVDPGDDHRFHLSDAVAMFGIRARPEAWSSAPLDRMTIGYDTGHQVHIYPDEIRIGSSDPAQLDAAALGEVCKANFEAIKAWMDGVTFAGTDTHGDSVTVFSELSSPTMADPRSGSIKIKK